MNPFTVLAPPLGQMLTWLYDFVPNYGIAIIILTLFVSLLLFPLTLKQTRSMKAMQEIQPEVKKLQKEYKDDREEMNKQMMALYQERGVNPAAGCLPLILQMPIWFALYRVFRTSPNADDPTVLEPSDIIPADSPLAEALLADDSSISFLSLDMLQSPSQAMSEGLSAGIPATLLVLVIVATSYYQVYQTTRRNKNNNNQPDNKQAQQMQMISKIMPLFMGFISWTFPMGLGLYFAVSNGFRVGQQAVIFRLDDDGGDDDSGKPAKGDAGGAPSPLAGLPLSSSPPSSSRRNMTAC